MPPHIVLEELALVDMVSIVDAELANLQAPLQHRLTHNQSGQCATARRCRIRLGHMEGPWCGPLLLYIRARHLNPERGLRLLTVFLVDARRPDIRNTIDRKTANCLQNLDVVCVTEGVKGPDLGYTIPAPLGA